MKLEGKFSPSWRALMQLKRTDETQEGAASILDLILNLRCIQPKACLALPLGQPRLIKHKAHQVHCIWEAPTTKSWKQLVSLVTLL